MNFGAQSAPGTAQRLIIAPLSGSRHPSTGSGDGHGRWWNQSSHTCCLGPPATTEIFSRFRSWPARETLVDVLQFAILGEQLITLRPTAQHPERCVHEGAVVLGRYPDPARTAWKETLNAVPLSGAQLVTRHSPPLNHTLPTDLHPTPWPADPARPCQPDFHPIVDLA